MRPTESAERSLGRSVGRLRSYCVVPLLAATQGPTESTGSARLSSRSHWRVHRTGGHLTRVPGAQSSRPDDRAMLWRLIQAEGVE